MHPSPPEEVFDRLAALAAKEQPLLLILVGPNGAGKSTFYQRYLSTISLPFINADVLAKTLVEAGAPEGEATERLAADLAEKKRQDLLLKRQSFITETVFSDPVGSKVEGLRTAQATGYIVAMIFVCVDSSQLTALRVASRVRDGGHRVPPDKIIARYKRMRVNVKAALPFVDLAIIVDNSSIRSPHRPVAATAGGKVIFRNPPLPWWADEVLQDVPS
jgi:predicted ABC-type ATPase